MTRGRRTPGAASAPASCSGTPTARCSRSRGPGGRSPGPRSASRRSTRAGCGRSPRMASTSPRVSWPSCGGASEPMTDEQAAAGGVLVDPRVLEQQLQVHVEDASGAVAALDVAPDPEEALAMRLSTSPSEPVALVSVDGSRIRPRAGRAVPAAAAVLLAVSSMTSSGEWSGCRSVARTTGVRPGGRARPGRRRWSRSIARSGARLETRADDPGVLRPAALARVHDELPLRQRDAGEAAGQHPDVTAVVHGERPEVGVPRPHAVLDEGRDGRQLHDRLRDPAARVGDQPLAQLLELRRSSPSDRRRGPCRRSRRPASRRARRAGRAPPRARRDPRAARCRRS